MIGGDDHIGDVRVGQALRYRFKLINRSTARLEGSGFAGFLIANGVDGVVVHVQHIAGFHQIAVFVPLHVEQILRLYGGASDFGENRGTSRRAAGILSIHDGIVMILGIQGQVRMRQQRRHAQLGIRGQRAELSRHGRGPPALLIEFPAEFLGDFIA